MLASTISLTGASDTTYVLEVDHFGVSVVLYCDVVQQNLHNPERFLISLLNLLDAGGHIRSLPEKMIDKNYLIKNSLDKKTHLIKNSLDKKLT